VFDKKGFPNDFGKPSRLQRKRQITWWIEKEQNLK